MSRSYCTYDEDWQRRKSLLIRSLFHDIPILSPVEEESNGSSHDYYIPTQEAFPPPRRPYSPLPPLIIEKIPATNKHDEPEEFYRELHKKIKKIYKKLFIENRNVTSMDLDSNYNDSSVNDYSEGSADNLVFNTENNSSDNSNSDIEDREERPSSASTKSNGYGADFESMDTAIIDVVNRTTSNEDVVMISEGEETDNENIDENSTTYENDKNSRSIGNDESTTQRMDHVIEEPQYSTTDNQNTTDSEETIEAEIEQRGETEAAIREVMDEYEMIETIQSNTVNLVDIDVSRVAESHHSASDDQEMTKSDESNEEEKQQAEAERHSDTNVSKSETFERLRISSEDENNKEQNDEPMEEDAETSQSSGGPYFKQVTTEALIHFDGYEDCADRESRVYEDSVKSVILPTRFRRVVASRNEEEDRIEVLVELEENADPRTASTFDTDETETTEEDLEEVSTPHEEPNLKHDEPGPIEEDEEMYASQSDDSDRDKEEPNVTETEEWRDLESDDTDEENEEIVDEPNDLGEMRLRLDTIEEDDEDISSHHSGEDFEVDVEESRTLRVKEMTVHNPTAEEETEVETDFRINAPEEEFEEISPKQIDVTKEHALETKFAHRKITDENIRTTPEANEEVMRSSPTEETEPTLTPRQNATKEQMKTKVTESTVKEMRTSQAVTDDVEELESPHSIELMRTPRPYLSHGTIPEPVTQGSSSESTGEHTALPQELTTLTLSIQDAVDNNMSELQTSNDMNEILTSIFNESQNKDGSTISGRKRKLVDKSIQAVEASRVTWEEMRANFFIGTPKIFRLCACSDHICP